jgi:competence protein ComEC
LVGGSALAALALAWLAGTVLQLQQPALWPVAGYAALLGGAVLLIGLLLGLPAALGRRSLVALCLVLVLAAFAAAGLRAAHRLADALPAALEGQDLVVTGIVAKMPRSSRMFSVAN